MNNIILSRDAVLSDDGKILKAEPVKLRPRVSASKPRICVLIPTHWEALMGGAQYQAQGLVHTLAETEDYEVYYLARRIRKEYSPKNHKVVQICKPGFLQKLATFFEAPQLLRQLRAIKPDIIYQRVGCAYTGVAAYYAKKYNSKLIWHVASTEDCTAVKFNAVDILRRPHKYIEKKFLEYGLRRADVVVAQTDDQNRLLSKHYGRPADHIIRNFLEVPPVQAKPSHPITVVWIGNFKTIKQPQHFVELARRLVGLRNARFLMIGAPSSDTAWQANLNQKIVSVTSLEYVGQLTQHEVNDRLARAHILVNTSEYEGFSNTYIQAWMQRVPVVSLNVNPDNIFEKYGVGILAGNIERLCSAVQNLIEDNEAREHMGNRAREYAINFHSMKNANELAALMSSMVKREG